MRFTGPIYELATYVRKEIIKIRKDDIPELNVINIETNRISKIDEGGSGYIFLNSLNIVLKTAVKRFKEDRGPYHARIVAYRNKQIERINRFVRKGLYGDNPKQFESGELVINKGGYGVMKGKTFKQIIENGTVFEVSRAYPYDGPYGIPCMNLVFKGKRFIDPIPVVADEGKKAYEAHLDKLKKEAYKNKFKWKEYFNFKDSFCYFSYNYATSSHKVQGSSIRYVFVLEDDIFQVRPTTVKEKLQSLYVSISRASFRVYIYNKAFKVDNSNLNRENLAKEAAYDEDEK